VSARQLPPRESVAAFEEIGITAFTTTRAAADFALGDGDPRPAGVAAWQALQQQLAPVAPRLASARQVHGTTILEPSGAWEGWLRAEGADGHFTSAAGTALAITIADCVPVFLAHPSGAVAVLHAGWRGVAGKIVARGVGVFAAAGLDVAELRMHLGPAICGRCYEVGPDVFSQLTGWETIRPRQVDLRSLLAEQGKEAGVRLVTSSGSCTKCDNGEFYSHRGGDSGRQVAVIFGPPA